jgi:hypothetical protein
VHRVPPAAPEQPGGRTPAGLILEIDVGELLAAVIPHDETGVVVFLERPRQNATAA